MLDGVGHDGNGDEVEYDDEDEEPCTQHLHDPIHWRGCVCLMGDVPVVLFTLAQQKCRLR